MAGVRAEAPGQDPDLGSACRELRDREPIFHRRELGTTSADVEAMTVADYWEVGASGRIYDRAAVLAILAERYADPEYDPMAGLEVSDFACRAAGDDVWLATYQLRQEDRLTRRVSVWRRTRDSWLLLYHQGTVIS